MVQIPDLTCRIPRSDAPASVRWAQLGHFPIRGLAKRAVKRLARLDELSAKLETERRIREVTDHIHTASLDEIIISVREDVQRLVGCERVTIFAKDPQKEELISKSMDGDEIREIRLPIASNSIAGYTRPRAQVQAKIARFLMPSRPAR